MVMESAGGESRLADAEHDTDTGPGHDTPEHRTRLKKRRVKVRRKQEKFPHALRIAILIGAPTLLWLGIYFVARALL